MSGRRPLAAYVILVLLVPVLASAQTRPADEQSIRVGATIFYDYTYTREPKKTDAEGRTISPNAFDVKRTYINIRGTVSDLVSFRITPDIRRETGSGSSLQGSLDFRLKYGYVQLALDEWIADGAQLRMGVIQTPYIEAQESIYRYRFQGTLFAERDGGLSSADAGVSLLMPLANDYGRVKVGLYNGEGYSKAEANDRKSLQVLAQIRPLPRAEGVLSGLQVTGFLNEDRYQGGAPRRRLILNATMEHARLNAGIDVVTGTDQPSPGTPGADSRGFSLFVTPFFETKGTGWEGLLRFDQFDEDVDLAGTQRRWIVGAAYWFPHPGGSATAAMLFDYERVTFPDVIAAPPREQRFAVHGLIAF